jgi:quercetin dioxygenase-like cupin family protein
LQLKLKEREMTIMDEAILRKKGKYKEERKIEGKTYRMVARSNKLIGVEVEFEPGNGTGFYAHEGEELRIMLKGKVKCTVGNKVYELEEGDILWHKSTTPHAIENIGEGNAVYLTVNTPPTTMTPYTEEGKLIGFYEGISEE